MSGIGLIASIAFTMPGADTGHDLGGHSRAGFDQFLWGMLAIFLFAGIGNASTFKQMPMIFERRQAGGVIGWTAAIAAFGPFFFGIGVTTSADGVLLHRHRVGRHVRRHHLDPVRPPGGSEAQLSAGRTLSLRRPRRTSPAARGSARR